MEKLVLATGNQGKINELQVLLNPLHIEVLSQKNFVPGNAVENGLSFVENALIKARFACQHSGLPSLADDSGLVVDALNGAPGLYSSRFAGENASDDDNNRKLIAALSDIPESQRTARFYCAVVLLRHELDPTPLIVTASWEGSILFEPRGNNGFGYDPLFWVNDLQKSSAELSAETKNKLSHRGQAIQKLISLLST
jgi:XTP/dITP diphosphohydrolase